MTGPRLLATCSQWMPSSKKASPPASVSSWRPVPGRLQAVGQRREVREDHVADGPVGQEPAESDRERLVVVVLAHDDDPLRVVPRVARPFEVGER